MDAISDLRLIAGLLGLASVWLATMLYVSRTPAGTLIWVSQVALAGRRYWRMLLVTAALAGAAEVLVILQGGRLDGAAFGLAAAGFLALLTLLDHDVHPTGHVVGVVGMMTAALGWASCRLACQGGALSSLGADVVLVSLLGAITVVVLRAALAWRANLGRWPSIVVLLTDVKSEIPRPIKRWEPFVVIALLASLACAGGAR